MTTHEAPAQDVTVVVEDPLRADGVGVAAHLRLDPPLPPPRPSGHLDLEGVPLEED